MNDCDDWVGVEPFSHSEQLERAHKAVDYQRGLEEKRIKRREWMALTCEEREAQRAKRKPNMMDGIMASILQDLLEPCVTFFDQPERTVRDPCSKCKERECPNAPTRVIPAKPGISGKAIRVEMGTMLEAPDAT